MGSAVSGTAERRRANWFDVDRSGLAELATRRGVPPLILEPIQNSWDENSSRVSLDIEAIPGKALAKLTVQDDSPDGFRDLADAYTMFRQSYKLANPEQRGRFNIGEKLLLAIATEARITSTTGSIIFEPTGRKAGRKQTPAGSILEALIKITRAELEEAVKLAMTLIPPEGITTIINGVELSQREPMATAVYQLETEIRGDEGGFRPTRRKASIRVHKVLDGETPSLYEMGIPVDAIDCPWHVEIMQKVPLAVDRSSVKTAFRLAVEGHVAEMMADHMTDDESRAGWIGTALEVVEDEEAIRSIAKKRFGKAVVFDPSDPEANKVAVDHGYAVVHGRELSKKAWGNVRDSGAISPAGHEFSQRLESDGDVEPEPEVMWTENMREFAQYALAFSHHCCDHGMAIDYYSNPMLRFTACCGKGRVSFNVGVRRVKEAIEMRNDQEFLDALLIHECAHHRSSDHMSRAFYDECCRIGARLRTFRETF